jgi:hypothetical protein
MWKLKIDYYFLLFLWVAHHFQSLYSFYARLVSRTSKWARLSMKGIHTPFELSLFDLEQPWSSLVIFSYLSILNFSWFAIAYKISSFSLSRWLRLASIKKISPIKSTRSAFWLQQLHIRRCTNRTYNQELLWGNMSSDLIEPSSRGFFKPLHRGETTRNSSAFSSLIFDSIKTRRH